MPKQPKPKQTSKIPTSRKAGGTSKKSSKAESAPVASGSTTAVNLYSSFLPIPLSIPSTIPIPSSSSKPITTVTHHIYVRPHTAKSNDDGDLPSDRTVFVANLPVDMGERDLRAVLSKWGVVERVVMGGRADGDALEKAVRGMDDDEDEDEDDEDGAEEEAGDGDAPNASSQPKFLGDPTLSAKKRRRLNKLPKSVPDITPLPALDPRSDPYGPSGLRTAHAVYLEPICVSRIMSYGGSLILFSPTTSTNPSGLPYYLARHSSLRPSLSAVKVFSDTSMARFDHLHSLLLSSRAKQSGAGALVDEDGFTMVVRGGTYSRTGGIADRMGKNIASVGVAGRGFGKEGFAGSKGKKGKGTEELQDFYKFQKIDKKRQELVDLRSKFEEDKKKVEEMKRAKRFRPY